MHGTKEDWEYDENGIVLEEHCSTDKERYIRTLVLTYKHLRGDNTRLCHEIWKQCSVHWNLPMDGFDALLEIMKAWRPESITRMRRDIVKPTKAQRAKEKEMHDKYAYSS